MWEDRNLLQNVQRGIDAAREEWPPALAGKLRRGKQKTRKTQKWVGWQLSTATFQKC